ncbi:YecA family protein [Gorillibacterium sp. sgz5001074]|uniref:YecA family protein n=1 Tax=Gorillibacterium sp. sgz5001074 TaxID=3446695 RepID=UPI003F680663
MFTSQDMQEIMMMEPKRWKELSATVTLPEALNRLTKDELTVIRQKLGLYGASSLKKSELVDFLAERIPGAMAYMLELWDEDRLKLFQALMNRRGEVPPGTEPQQWEYFAERGLLVTGTRPNGAPLLVVPDEVQTAFRSLDLSALRKTITRNTEWLRLTRGLLFHYGVMPHEELHRLLEELTERELDSADFGRVVEDNGCFDDTVQVAESFYYHFDVEDPEQVLREQRKRPELKLRALTRSMAYESGARNYNDENPEFKQFLRFLRAHYELTVEEAEETVVQSVYAFQNGEHPGQVVHLFRNEFELMDKADVEGFMEHLVSLFNGTRMWVLKGHTPRELGLKERGTAVGVKNSPAARAGSGSGNVIHFPGGASPATAAAKPTAPGRNDPCPCGSGKKYKKCCMS